METPNDKPEIQLRKFKTYSIADLSAISARLAVQLNENKSWIKRLERVFDTSAISDLSIIFKGIAFPHRWELFQEIEIELDERVLDAHRYLQQLKEEPRKSTAK